MTRCIVVSAFVIAGVLTNAQSLSAQVNVAESVFQSQSVVLQRVFRELRDAGPEKRAFNLWMADLLLTQGQGQLGAAGLEEAVASDAIGALRRLEVSGDRAVADLSARLRQRILDELRTADASNTMRDPLDFTRPTHSEIELPSGASAQQDAAPGSEWLPLAVVPGLEYEISAGDCPLVRVLAMGSDRQTFVAGGTAFARPFSFISSRPETVHLRVRTPLCDEATMSVRAVKPSVLLTRAAAPAEAPVIAAGERYRGSVAQGSDQWMKLAVEQGSKYTFEAIAQGTLDTVIEVYDADASRMLVSDDDGGEGRSSKVDLTNADARTLFIKVRGYDPTPGQFEFVVSSIVSPLLSAETIEPGAKQAGTLAGRSEQWWRMRVQKDRRYTVETSPSPALDTVITLFGADATSEIASDDDGGNGLGSKLYLNSTSETTYFIKVSSLDQTSGTYGLLVSSGPLPAAVAQSMEVGGRAGGTLTGEGTQWWKLAVEAGQRYIVEAIPEAKLDTTLAVFKIDGSTRIAYNDDGGVGLGSKLELRPTETGTLLIGVEERNRLSGTYDLLVSTRAPVLELAGDVRIGRLELRRIVRGGDEWFRMSARAGVTYRIEARPKADLDTELVLYEVDGVAKIASNDDAGTGLASLLNFTSAVDKTVLIQVKAVLRTAGEYEFIVSTGGP